LIVGHTDTYLESCGTERQPRIPDMGDQEYGTMYTRYGAGIGRANLLAPALLVLRGRSMMALRTNCSWRPILKSQPPVADFAACVDEITRRRTPIPKGPFRPYILMTVFCSSDSKT